MKHLEAPDVSAWLDEAAKAARASVCYRRRCGAILVHAPTGKVVCGAENKRPGEAPVHCDPYALPPAFKSDKACCVHAEQRVIMQALAQGIDLTACDMVFASVDEAGVRLPSGQPYCTICSKMALEAGVRGWILEHAQGPMWYGAAEYNEISFQFNGE